MPRSDKLSTYKTSIQVSPYDDTKLQWVIYHNTMIVKVTDKEIILNFGGWDTVTTRRKMNQASKQFGLGYSVYRDKGETWIETSKSRGKYDGNIVIISRETDNFYMGASDRLEWPEALKLIGETCLKSLPRGAM